MVSILDSRAEEKQILYTWKLQNLKGLAAVFCYFARFSKIQT